MPVMQTMLLKTRITTISAKMMQTGTVTMQMEIITSLCHKVNNHKIQISHHQILRLTTQTKTKRALKIKHHKLLMQKDLRTLTQKWIGQRQLLIQKSKIRSQTKTIRRGQIQVNSKNKISMPRLTSKFQRMNLYSMDLLKVEVSSLNPWSKKCMISSAMMVL